MTHFLFPYRPSMFAEARLLRFAGEAPKTDPKTPDAPHIEATSDKPDSQRAAAQRLEKSKSDMSSLQRRATTKPNIRDYFEQQGMVGPNVLNFGRTVKVEAADAKNLGTFLKSIEPMKLVTKSGTKIEFGNETKEIQLGIMGSSLILTSIDEDGSIQSATIDDTGRFRATTPDQPSR